MWSRSYTPISSTTALTTAVQFSCSHSSPVL
ncbi:unnamed protein product [Coregonus sp. 'balchen']|nr:unnamed protein product [Coregonus sp. 'balchen']